MLSLGNFPTQLQYNSLFLSPITRNLHFCSKTRHSLFTNRVNPLDFQAFLSKRPTGFFSNALRTKKNGKFSSSEMKGPSNSEDGFDDNFIDVGDDGEFEEDDGEFEGDDDDDVIVPLQNMKKWLENRPRGFGEGKVYDTSIEDKLVEEIEQSRKVQFDNINMLKSNPMKEISKKDLIKQDKASMQIRNGFRVRLFNLPKKKNIHKDLKLVFKGISGIQDIVPVVSGNEKTRDPVCKGLAFINFKHKDEAEWFVKNFSGKSVNFGEVEKQIKCEVMTSKLPKLVPNEANRTPKLAILTSDEGYGDSDDTNVPSLNSWEESERDDIDKKYVLAQWKDDEEIRGTSSTLDSDFSEELEREQESAAKGKASSSKQGRRPKDHKKKAVASDTSKNKIPKLTVPGSAKRLKMREKAMLTGVFSKYGANASPTVQDQNR